MRSTGVYKNLQLQRNHHPTIGRSVLFSAQAFKINPQNHQQLKVLTKSAKTQKALLANKLLKFKLPPTLRKNPNPSKDPALAAEIEKSENQFFEKIKPTLKLEWQAAREHQDQLAVLIDSLTE